MGTGGIIGWVPGLWGGYGRAALPFSVPTAWDHPILELNTEGPQKIGHLQAQLPSWPRGACPLSPIHLSAPAHLGWRVAVPAQVTLGVTPNARPS